MHHRHCTPSLLFLLQGPSAGPSIFLPFPSYSKFQALNVYVITSLRKQISCRVSAPFSVPEISRTDLQIVPAKSILIQGYRVYIMKKLLLPSCSTTPLSSRPSKIPILSEPLSRFPWKQYR